jgi:PhnB protein
MDFTEVPTRYPAIVPYLTVADAPLLMAFLERAFGAVRRFAAPGEGGKILHAEMTLGDGVIMMSDAAETVPPPAHLCHYVTDAEAVYAAALAAGGSSLSAPEAKPYGQRVAGIRDPAGNIWWICQVIA